MVNVNKTLIFLAAAVAVSAGVIEKRQGSYWCNTQMQTCHTGLSTDIIYDCTLSKCTTAQGHGCIPNVTNNGKYNAWCS
ncbi:hypothetical protein A1F99_139090 [Pyrenophora tritici-repentis]|nr:hypothetical protein A1F99_139090 [Pyrenophora tritici-repentis]